MYTVTGSVGCMRDHMVLIPYFIKDNPGDICGICRNER